MFYNVLCIVMVKPTDKVTITTVMIVTSSQSEGAHGTEHGQSEGRQSGEKNGQEPYSFSGREKVRQDK